MVAEDTRSSAALPGSRPAGASDEAAAARQVREMFTRIAPHYDLLNHLLSMRFDVLWRKRVARRFRHVLARSDVRVLDLCCGTGDLTFALASEAAAAASTLKRGSVAKPAEPHQGAIQQNRRAKQFIGADFAHPMLLRAREKTASRHADSHIEFLEADALALPFADQSFDLLTTAFGFRNLANYAAGLAEFRRVLHPGGSVAILEFAEPDSAIFGQLFRFYFHRVLPKLGGIVSGNSQAYDYLPNSVTRFPRPAPLCDLMQRTGFAGARFERWTGGIVALHTATRM